MKNILFIHQSSEWYGSDKVLWNIVTQLPSDLHPIVVLPSEGILLDKLRASGIEVHIAQVAKVSQATMSLSGITQLPFDLLKSFKHINEIVNGRTIALVHSNTLAIFAGAFWSKWQGIPHLWHVHEILLNPKFLKYGYPLLLKFLANKIICNSNPTRKWITDMQPSLKSRSITIWNGIRRETMPDFEKTNAFRVSLGINKPEQVLITLVGRINHWKGQSIFIDAANQLLKKYDNYVFLIMGSPAIGSEKLVDQLQEQVNKTGRPDAIKIIPYSDNIWTTWDAADVVVVPSIFPEPFGLVAIEAMAANKPVIASRHGGLVDIIENEKSGLLVSPGNTQQLISAIETLAQSPSLRNSMGAYGYQVQKKLFSLDSQMSKLLSVYYDMIGT